jgi:hypothetical protein
VQQACLEEDAGGSGRKHGGAQMRIVKCTEARAIFSERNGELTRIANPLDFCFRGFFQILASF